MSLAPNKAWAAEAVADLTAAVVKAVEEVEAEIKAVMNAPKAAGKGVAFRKSRMAQKTHSQKRRSLPTGQWVRN